MSDTEKEKLVPQRVEIEADKTATSAIDVARDSARPLIRKISEFASGLKPFSRKGKKDEVAKPNKLNLTPLEEILVANAKLPLGEGESVLRKPQHKSVQRVHNMREAVVQSRKILPLPHEQQEKLQRTDINWLMGQLYTCPTKEALIEFGRNLENKDLVLLFPAYAACNSAYDRERLLMLIKMRACRMLYINGWVTVQALYPKSAVQKALQELCAEILHQQELSRSFQQQITKAENLLLEQQLKLPQHIDWSRVPLITEVALPASRNLVNQLIDSIENSAYTAQEFLQKYGIYPDLPLGQAILEAFVK